MLLPNSQSYRSIIENKKWKIQEEKLSLLIPTKYGKYVHCTISRVAEDSWISPALYGRKNHFEQKCSGYFERKSYRIPPGFNIIAETHFRTTWPHLVISYICDVCVGTEESDTSKFMPVYRESVRTTKLLVQF